MELPKQMGASSKSKKIYDVIIVGAGPVGLHTANILAERGLEVLAIERKRKIGHDVVCAGVVGAEVFDSLHLNRDSILREVKTIRFLSPLGTPVIYTSVHPLAYIIDRKKFDTLLFQSASERGVQVVLGENAQVVDIKGRLVTVTAKHVIDNTYTEYKAKIVVLATGISTRLNRTLGLGYPPYYVNTVNTSTKNMNDGVVTVVTGTRFSKGGFGWLIPEDQSTVRIGLMTEGDPRPYFKTLSKKFLSEPVLKPSFRPIAQGLVSRTFSDRVISVGECAGQIKTTTGGGIYFGLISSELAVEAVLNAFRKGDFSANALSLYESRWKAKIGQEIKLGIHLREIWSTLSDEQIEKLFKFVASDGVLGHIFENIKFDWHVSTLWKFLRQEELSNLLRSLRMNF